MGRKPCCAKEGLNRGAWTAREDKILTNYISIHGGGKWRDLPLRAGLMRCGKSCRLRWLNYLRPDIKRGNISGEEEELIVKLHKLLGNRWSLIAGRLPGRTDNEIKNYWNTNLSKRMKGQKTQNFTKHRKKLGEKKSMENSSTELKPGTRTEEPHKVIRTKATRCTKVVIPHELYNEMFKKNEERESRSSSTLVNQDDSSNFLMDFDISDLFISDLLNSEFCQETNKNNNGVDGDFGGMIISSSSDFPVPAYEAFVRNSTDETILDNWEASPLQPYEALELKTLASFLDSEEEWIK